MEPPYGHQATARAGVHLVLGVPVHGDALRRPVLDISGTVDHGKVVPVSAGAQRISLSDSVEVTQGLGTDISHLNKEIINIEDILQSPP